MAPSNDLYHKVRAVSSDNPLLNRIYGYQVCKSVQDYFFLSPTQIRSLTFSINALPHLLTQPYDLIFVVSGLWSAIAITLVRWLRGVPFIVCSQAGITRDDFWMAKLNPDAYVVLLKYWEDRLVERVPSVRARVIPQGIALERFNSLAAPHEIALARPLILCVGAAEPLKNLRCTIDAVAKLSKGGLLILGDGQLRTEVAAYGLEKLGPQRFQMLAVAHEEMPGYYAACDIFTMTSEAYCEAFGYVYLEAMACDKPIVATDDTVRRDIIGGAGYYCDPHDPAAYAQALQLAITTTPDESPRDRALRFGWIDVGNQYRQLIEEYLAH